MKSNYKKQYSNLLCRLCEQTDEIESEEHVMKCVNIVSEGNLKTELENIAFTDIFGNLEKQIKIVKVLNKVFKIWNIKIEAKQLGPRDHQVHLPSSESASLPNNSSNYIVSDFGL